jgi:hypothetical protein
MLERMRGWVGLGCVVVMAACGSDPVAVDPAVAPFVGTWDAVVFRVTGDAPPNTVVDLLTLGSFWINVQPSGTYTATFQYLQGFAVVGQLTVQSSSALTLDPRNGPPEPGMYVFATADSLVLDGATQFDFNLDGTREPAQGRTELVRR